MKSIKLACALLLLSSVELSAQSGMTIQSGGSVTVNGNLILIPAGLVAYYPFNGNANDESGNGNNGSVSSTTLTPDRFGHANTAYYFDGNTSYITIPGSNSLNISGNQISLVAWVKWNGSISTQLYIIDKWSGRYNLALNGNGNIGSGCPRFAFADGMSVLDYNSSITPNTWHLLTATYDGSVAKIYLDNLLVSSQPFSNYISYSSSDLLIGSYRDNHTDFTFSGVIDDVRIYNRAITNEEVQSLFQEGGWAK